MRTDQKREGSGISPSTAIPQLTAEEIVAWRQQEQRRRDWRGVRLSIFVAVISTAAVNFAIWALTWSGKLWTSVAGSLTK